MTFDTGRWTHATRSSVNDRAPAEERRVVVRARVVGLDDEALEVVHVGREPDRARVLDRLARRRRLERPVEQRAGRGGPSPAARRRG